MFLRRLPVFLLLLALGVLPGRAQNRPSGQTLFSIGGSVRDESGQHAMEGILVALKQSGGTPVTTTFTRGNGEFEFDGLPIGDYVIEINLTDYEQARETVSIMGGSRLGITIFLKRTSKAVNPPAPMSISAHQLSVPHKAHDEFEKGMTLIYLQSDYRSAIAEFQHSIKDFPAYYEAYAEEGGAYYHLEEMAPAEEALRKSIDLSAGKYADALFTLAALLSDTKRYPEAETTARQAITVDASSWRGPFELARAQAALKQPAEAEKNATHARDLMPDNPAVYLLLSNVHIQLRDYLSLLRDLDDYLRLAPTGAEADQARQTRERVQKRVDAMNGGSTTSGQEKPQSDAQEGDAASSKHPAPPSDPDTSGLPSLPPPSPGNP